MTAEAKTAANQLSRLVHLPCTSTTSTRAITADPIRAQVIIALYRLGLTVRLPGPGPEDTSWAGPGRKRELVTVAAAASHGGSLCGPFGGYDGWWFWRRRHHQLGSYLGRIPSELA